MNFGAWVRLDEAEFPAAGGVLQARLEEGLVVYPRGKSAMVYYAGARDLGAAARALAAANPGARWLVRVSREPVMEPEEAAARLIAGFVERFGAAPRAP
ncbi:MAG: hypothetical protein IPK80_00390 [Nannocystis sp.]|nr:hypothetical protein [Nannocystis sp.]